MANRYVQFFLNFPVCNACKFPYKTLKIKHFNFFNWKIEARAELIYVATTFLLPLRFCIFWIFHFFAWWRLSVSQFNSTLWRQIIICMWFNFFFPLFKNLFQKTRNSIGIFYDHFFFNILSNKQIILIILLIQILSPVRIPEVLAI